MVQKLTQSVSVAANATNSNVLSGYRIENLPADGRTYKVTIASTGSATGLEESAFVGANGNPIEGSIVSTANRIPILEDDLSVVFFAKGNQKLQLQAQNTTAGALTYFFTVIVESV